MAFGSMVPGHIASLKHHTIYEWGFECLEDLWSMIYSSEEGEFTDDFGTMVGGMLFIYFCWAIALYFLVSKRSCLPTLCFGLSSNFYRSGNYQTRQ